MKDKEWLKEEIKKLLTVRNQFYPHDEMVDLGLVLLAIDQLDEPQKPVIPQFVADYYNDYKNYELTFEEWFECSEFGKGGKTENKTFEWLLDNSHEVNIERQFILADIIAHGLNGYEMEKEKKYYIYDKSTKGYLGYNADKTRLSWYTSKFPNDVFTEQEIKEIDKRYWAFAEEVTK